MWGGEEGAGLQWLACVLLPDCKHPTLLQPPPLDPGPSLPRSMHLRLGVEGGFEDQAAVDAQQTRPPIHPLYTPPTHLRLGRLKDDLKTRHLWMPS